MRVRLRAVYQFMQRKPLWGKQEVKTSLEVEVEGERYVSFLAEEAFVGATKSGQAEKAEVKMRKEKGGGLHAEF